jgi:hypothetical protein
MKPYLLKLSCGRLSLEFQDEDRRALTAAIRERFGQPDIEVFPGASICRFGGASFTFYDQWGEPCLISGSERGDDLLRILVGDLAPAELVSPDTVEHARNLEA